MLFEKVFEMNSLPSLLCRVRFAHTTKQTSRQKMANAIIWLCPPATPSKKIRKHNFFAEKMLSLQIINYSVFKYANNCKIEDKRLRYVIKRTIK